MQGRVVRFEEWGRAEGYRISKNSAAIVHASEATLIQQPWLSANRMILDYYLLSSGGDLLFSDPRWAQGIVGKCFITSLEGDGCACAISLDDYPQLGRFEEPCFEMGASENWGHWMADILPKLLVYDELADRDSRRLVFGHLNPAMLESLELLGIDPAHHVAVGGEAQPRARYVFADLAVAGPVDRAAAYAYLRRRFQESLPASGQEGKRIYFSRAHMRPRSRVYNDEAVEQHFRRLGFDIVRGDELSVAQSVRLMVGAEIVAATLGAAFGNFMLAGENAEFICLFPEPMRQQGGHLGFSSWLAYYEPFFPRMGVVWGGFGDSEQAYAKEHGLLLADIAASYDLAQIDMALMQAEKRLMLKRRGLA